MANVIPKNQAGPYQKMAMKTNSVGGIIGNTIKGIPRAGLEMIPGVKGIEGLGRSVKKIQSRNEAIASMKKGGKVKKTGMYKLHKGERVLNAKQTKKFNAGAFESARKKHFGLGKSA